MNADGKSHPLKKVVSILLPIGISGALVVWILSGIEDPDVVLDAALNANPFLLLAIVPVSLASHWLRATRWLRLLGMPGASRVVAFSSVMIGYAVNVVVPLRAGEAARLVNMNVQTGAPYPRMITTLVAERLVDLLFLIVFLGLSLLFAGDRIAEAFPVIGQTGPLLVAAAVVGLVGLLGIAFAGERLARIVESLAGKLHAGLGERAGHFTREAARGFEFVRDPIQAAVVAAESVAIWVLYWGTLILGLAAFGFLADIGLDGGTVVFSITSSGVLVPSQGAIGAYHTAGRESLHLLYDVPRDLALARVTVVHAILFLGVGGIGGALAWLLQLLRGKPRPQNEASDGR